MSKGIELMRPDIISFLHCLIIGIACDYNDEKHFKAGIEKAEENGDNTQASGPTSVV